MSNRICGRCKSSVVVPWNNVKDFYKCMNCNAIGYAEKFPEKTLFDLITQSPETLANEFVSFDHGVYYSGFIGQYFNTYTEAIAATVARLKEVTE